GGHAVSQVKRRLRGGRGVGDGTFVGTGADDAGVAVLEAPVGSAVDHAGTGGDQRGGGGADARHREVGGVGAGAADHRPRQGVDAVGEAGAGTGGRQVHVTDVAQQGDRDGGATGIGAADRDAIADVGSIHAELHQVDIAGTGGADAEADELRDDHAEVQIGVGGEGAVAGLEVGFGESRGHR